MTLNRGERLRLKMTHESVRRQFLKDELRTYRGVASEAASRSFFCT